MPSVSLWAFSVEKLFFIVTRAACGLLSLLFHGWVVTENCSAEVLLCEDGSHRLIRRAETPRDYFATLDFLPAMKPLFEGYDD